MSAISAITRQEGSPHVVQLYRETSRMVEVVVGWLAPAFREGGAAIAICTPENAALLRERLARDGFPVAELEASGRFAVVDAEGAMSRFMVGGSPHGASFKRLARGLVRDARRASPVEGAPIRAWGEMVNLLWLRGSFAAAQRLEALWNEVIAEERGLELLCSYRIDRLRAASYRDGLARVCACHGEVTPDPEDEPFEQAVGVALARLVTPTRSETLRTLLVRRARGPPGWPPGEKVLAALHDMNPRLAEVVIEDVRRNLAEPIPA